MAVDIDQLEQKQYIDALKGVKVTANYVQEALKTLNAMMGISGNCYLVNDSDIGGNYLRNVYDKVNKVSKTINNTVIPQTTQIIKKFETVVEIPKD